jgi:hypothetical protein
MALEKGHGIAVEGHADVARGELELFGQRAGGFSQRPG